MPTRRTQRRGLLVTAFIGLICLYGAALSSERQLEAIFISSNSASALIGGELYREGDQLDDARIAEIRRGELILVSDRGMFSVPVGAATSMRVPALAESMPPVPAADALSAGPPIAVPVATQASQPVMPEATPDVINVTPEPLPNVAATPGSHDAPSTYRARWGDTLSEIATGLDRPGDVSLYSAMNAIYAANPHAFNGDMDHLRSGSILTLPSGMAMANAGRNEATHQPIAEPDEPTVSTVASLIANAQTLTVEPGDTLSDIAQSVKPPGITTWQMMHQLYTANPGAFGTSIDVLFAGASLVVPDAARDGPTTPVA